MTTSGIDSVPTLEDGPAREAWKRLATGNARFAAGQPSHPRQGIEHRKKLSDEQNPFACVLGCVDSRVPAELVFDVGLGDLIAARSAGQSLDTAIVGSVEFAVDHLGLNLVLVLGHTNCGAVTKAVEAVYDRAPIAGELAALIRDMEASVRATPFDKDRRRLVDACAVTQVLRVSEQLVQRIPTLRTDRVLVVPALYEVETGLVRQARNPS